MSNKENNTESNSKKNPENLPETSPDNPETSRLEAYLKYEKRSQPEVLPEK